MKTSSISQKWLNKYPYDSWQQIGIRILYSLLVGFALLMFGHSVLVSVGHFLHVLISILEWGCEHLLHWLFNVSPKQGEIMTFWLGFAILAGLARPVSCKACAALKNSYTSWLAKPKLDRYVMLIQFFVISTVLALFS
ncbi:hypothetical protein [Crenothrix polyspora]|uniref:Uncharacterized protein n=1 Tax=Crenothrix polyspora TaxID=360316 RepID=A0A1R4HK48_9GAMM|nr:hypothetical protein [Crenothrix polyspora]SJM96595.1 membrane hypothetical protein [Crenothrix polyspora]